MRERLRGAFQRAFRAFAVGVISLLARALFGARVCADGGAIDDNALFLCAHESVWDFAFLIYALRPRRVRCAGEVLGNRFLSDPDLAAWLSLDISQMPAAAFRIQRHNSYAKSGRCLLSGK